MNMGISLIFIGGIALVVVLLLLLLLFFIFKK